MKAGENETEDYDTTVALGDRRNSGCATSPAQRDTEINGFSVHKRLKRGNSNADRYLHLEETNQLKLQCRITRRHSTAHVARRCPEASNEKHKQNAMPKPHRVCVCISYAPSV